MQRRIPLVVETGLVVALVALAAVFRLWQLDEIPPGLFYDEAYDALDALVMLRNGGLPVFFPGNFGREPLFIWLLAAAQAIAGPEPYTLRLTAALLGILTVPALYLAVREIGGRPAALASAAVLAVLYWHVSLSRFAIRPIVFPLVACLALWWLARAWRTGRWWDGAIGGALFGLCAYTYLAARLLPLIALLAVGWLFVFRREATVARWRTGLVALTAAAVVVLPLATYFIANPAAFTGRTDQVIAGTVAVPDPSAGGDPGTIRENPLRTLGMFLVRGDENERTNLPGRPVFDPILGAAFLVGLAFCLTGRAGGAGWLALAALVVLSLPSALSTYAPHYLRAIGASPAAALVAGIGLGGVVKLLARLPLGRLAGIGIAAAIIGYAGWRTQVDYFEVWANELSSYTAWDVGIANLGSAIADLPSLRTVYVSPLPGDHPTLRYMSGRDDLRGFDGRAGYVLPPVEGSFGIIVATDRLTEPAIGSAYAGVPPVAMLLDPVAQVYATLTTVGGTPRLPNLAPVRARFQTIADLAGTVGPITVSPGTPTEFTIVWRVNAPTAQPLTRFVQLVGPVRTDGSRVWSQVDGAPIGGSYPTDRWRAGEIVVERIRLNMPRDLAPGSYAIIAGWYGSDGVRLGANGEDTLGTDAVLWRGDR